MPCYGCIQTRQAFVTSAYAGNVRGMASALGQAFQINVEKARQVIRPRFVDRRGVTPQGTQSGNYRSERSPASRLAR